MGFFTEEERSGLQIDRMIMHVVSKEPFQNASEFAEVEHEDYFLARLDDMDAAANFEFVEESQTRETLRRMGAGEITFQSGARILSRAFATTHSGNTKDGAFFIFELSSSNSPARFYAMLKYDYKTVLARTRKVDSRKHLRKIVEAFVQDARALQKSCIARVEDGMAYSTVSAKDRMGKTPDLTDYFKRFLDVVRDRSDEELNKAASDAVLEVLKSHKENLPDRDVKAALRVAHEILRGAQLITSEVITHAVVRAADAEEDEELRNSLSKAVNRRVRASGLDGLEFPPVQNILNRASRVVLKTRESVEITYPAGLEGSRVNREPLPQGGEIITIRTDSAVEEKVVSEKASR